MFGPALAVVFGHAAVPQKIVMAALVAVTPLCLALLIVARRGGARAVIARRTISDLRVAAPALGLLTGALNSFHMGETIARLPFDPTLKQLTPGIFEVSTLVGLGAMAGIVAVVTHAAVGACVQQRTF